MSELNLCPECGEELSSSSSKLSCVTKGCSVSDFDGDVRELVTELESDIPPVGSDGSR